MPSVRSLPVLLALVLACTLAAPRAARAELDARATDRCVRAAVRIVVTAQNGTTLASGSGSIIDARGYILTNFHVVGHVGPETGAPGTLFVPSNRYDIGLSTSARLPAELRYVARVVRADTRLDLALLEIIETRDGTPIRGSQRFPAVRSASSDAVRPGASVYAFGFPLGLQTVNATGGQITGFQLNAEGEVAWLRSDAEFNPGNSGGMLVDSRGRIVAVPTAVVHGRSTLEPIELARPIDRIPAEWRAAMARRVNDVRIDGVPEVKADSRLAEEAIGDIGSLGEREVHYFRVHASLRLGVIRSEGAAPDMALIDERGRIVRRGRGGVEVGGSDPATLFLAIIAENPLERPLRYTLVGERVEPAVPSAGSVSTLALPQVAPVPRGPVPTPPVPTPMPGRASVAGSVFDAASGRPLPNVFILVARPGVDLARAIALFLEGRLDQRTLDAQLVGSGRTDASGRYVVHGLPVRTRYPAAAFVNGRRPVMLEIAVADEGAVIELNPIAIVP